MTNKAKERNKKSSIFNLKVDTDKTYYNDMDDQSPYQMVTGVNSGEISPEIKFKGNNLQV